MGKVRLVSALIFAASYFTQNARAGISSSATSAMPFYAEKIRSYDGGRLSIDEPHFDSSDWKPTLTCKQVAVSTTINPVTKALRQVASLNDWCLVIVGDLKTPPQTHLELESELPKSVKFLSYDEQTTLPYASVGSTPTNHFGRKNLGYLYAAHAGAELIFDFDDDNELLPGGIIPTSFDKGRHVHHVRGNASVQVLNPYKVGFGATQMWPRGFPLEMINDESFSINPLEVEVPKGIIQSLANHDPDVDAIYRMGPRSALELPYTFESGGPPIILKPHIYAPYNAQATLVTREAFWAQMLPMTVHGRVSDIWRSYISQRLLWSAGLRLTFHSAWVVQVRNAHNYMGDYMSERPLYETAGELIRVLHMWNPANDLPSSISSLYIHLYEHGFLQAEDVVSVHNFLTDLSSIGYCFPSISKHKPGELEANAIQKRVRDAPVSSKCDT